MAYVYQLVDPRSGQPFYIGKGSNKRAWDHLKKWDDHNPLKSKFIDDIRVAGLEPEVEIIADKLSDKKALIFEVGMISLHGRIDIDESGILTNRTMGGEGGDTSMFFTDESYRKIRAATVGVNNAMAKLNKEQVIEIYYSTKEVKELIEEFGVSQVQINGIKRKKYYASVTGDIKDSPGLTPYQNEKKRVDNLAAEIYLATGTPSELSEKFNVKQSIVRSIKNRSVRKKLTEHLGEPGEIIKHNLSWDDLEDIRVSSETLVELGKKYDVHPATIRNIKTGYTRSWG